MQRENTHIKLHLSESPGPDRFIVVETRAGATGEEAVTTAYESLVAALRDEGATLLHERIFGTRDAAEVIFRARSRVLRASGLDTDGPSTFIEGASPGGEILAGVLVQAAKTDALATPPEAIVDDGVRIGAAWQTETCRFALLQNLAGLIHVPGSDNSPAAQTTRLLKRADRLLRARGLSYEDVSRTWFYLADILDWYGAFNRARTAEYAAFGIMPEPGAPLRLPASTGIGGRNLLGAAGVADILAVRPAAGFPVKQLTNPAQKDAFAYGSSFSRGAVIETGESATIHVSGTAAIDAAGKSLHPGDPASQLAATFDKLEALIAGPGATLRDIVSANVFVKDPSFAPIYRELAAQRGLPDFPGVLVVADICRAELLVEVDAVAVVTR